MPTTTAFTVGMTCEGCAGAIKRILGKMEGVATVDTDVASKRVLVTGEASAEAMLAALQKWAASSGKSVALEAGSAGAEGAAAA